jgi:hypothetical protein
MAETKDGSRPCAVRETKGNGPRLGHTRHRAEVVRTHGDFPLHTCYEWLQAGGQRRARDTRCQTPLAEEHGWYDGVAGNVDSRLEGIQVLMPNRSIGDSVYHSTLVPSTQMRLKIPQSTSIPSKISRRRLYRLSEASSAMLCLTFHTTYHRSTIPK